MNAPDLHCHSTFSLLDGMGSPKDVVARAKALGWGAVCLTEHGWMGSAPTFYKAAQAEGLKPIIGCEFYIASNEILGENTKASRWDHYHLTVLALSAEGYHNLVAWTTFSNQRPYFYDRPRISLEAMVEIAPYPLHHNVVLSGCLSSELCVVLEASKNGGGINLGLGYVEALKSIFPNFYIEVQNHEVPKFLDGPFVSYQELVGREAKVRNRLLKLAQLTNTPIVVTNDSHYQEPKQRKSHVMLIAQKRREFLTENRVGEYLPQYSYFGNYMRSMEQIEDRTPGAKNATANIHDIVAEADIRLDPLDNFRYSIPHSGYKDEIREIRRRSKRRLMELVEKHGPKARERFEHELESMGDFAHYLLLISDFIINARRRGILTNTRGSAANSLLCYCMKIHDIDPIEYKLLFTRFYNPSRKKLPDIDVDIDKDRYEDFMQFVIERMNELEGEGQVVQICNYGTFANRSAFRHMAEALGVSKETQDEIAKLLPQMIDSGMVDDEDSAYELIREEYPEIYELASGVFDAIKNVSQHACGWLFGTRDRPLEKWVPMVLIASSNSQVTQFNLKALGDMGLVKGDFLRLRTLSVIQRTRRMLGQDSLDITDIPLDDPETFQMLREGRTEGVFTLQGKENRRGVMEVEAENVHDVIRAVAIYRPALTREGKHTLYNNRRKGIEEVEYVDEIAERVMGETFGVPVFQEQAMELAEAVGMSYAEVDEIYEAIKLAKGVGRGAKEAFAAIEPKFRKAASALPRSVQDGHWRDIQGFQGYGFNRGHASSYAILAVRAAWLKRHHPAEFFTALLDVYPEKSKYVAAARTEGFRLLAPDINTSGAGFTLDRASGGIRVGLSRIKGLGPVAIGSILAGQPYSSYEDFRARNSGRAVNARRVEALAALGALESVGIARGDGDEDSDVTEFKRLGFVLQKPKAFRGCKPKHVAARTSDRGWKHLGRVRGAEPTGERASVSKMFWIPPIQDVEKGKDKFKLLDLKASPYAQVKTYLLTAVDENGIPFHIMANEDKEGEVMILEFLAKHFRGATVCLEGTVRGPFLTDGPMGFRFYGVTGAFNGDPQVWNVGRKEKEKRIALIELDNQKRRMKQNAA